MLHIILLVLKIISIVLICILGILILVIAGVLFVPVRYRIKVVRQEGDGNPPAVVFVKVTWLLHLINILVRYPNKVIVRARVFIFTLFRIPGKEKKSKKKRSKNEEPESNRSEDMHHNADPDAQARAEDRETPQTSSSMIGNESSVTGEEDFSCNQNEREESAEKKSIIAKIKSIIDKIRQIIQKIKSFFENIQYTIRNLCDKIKSASDNIQYYREVLESDSFRRSLQLCKGELGWVFKKLKPDKFEADFIIGMEDPAATGEILAVFGILYPLIGQHVRVAGDFECDKMHIEGQLYIRGKIRAFTFFRVMMRIYFNKDIKKLIKILKKEAV